MPLLGSLSSIDGEYSSQQVFVYASGSSVDEGATLTFTIQAQGIADGTTLYYTSNGSVSSGDLTSGSLTGSVVLGGSSNTVVMSFSNDLTTEGTEYITLEVRTGSTSGPIVGTSERVSIIDTSTAPYGSALFLPSNFPSGNNLVSTFFWTVPAGVTSVSIVCVGAGGSGIGGGIYTVCSGGGGGALSYKNNVSVTPGETLYVRVGEPAQFGYQSYNGGNSSVHKVTSNVFIVGAKGGTNPWESSDSNPNGTANTTPALRMTGANGTSLATGSAPTSWSDGGGQGGLGGSGVGYTTAAGSGGGAGGYAGNGGNGGSGNNSSGSAGLGGGGGGGAAGRFSDHWGGGGGGVFPYGQTANGAGGTWPAGQGGGGSVWDTSTMTHPSARSYTSMTNRNTPNGGRGFGGGGAGVMEGYYATTPPLAGSGGVVRIVWPGLTRQFPSTDVANTSGESVV